MSDSETPAPPHHPTLGGKSLQSLERPKYKSWRKKYRKMKGKFEVAQEDNKKFFGEEQKLECIAKRLREELDGLLELCLDLNNTPSIHPHLRFDVSHSRHRIAPEAVAANITPEQANDTLSQYTAAVRSGQMPPLDLHVVRQQIDERLAAQDVLPLSSLEASVPHPIDEAPVELEEESVVDMGPGFLTLEQEAEYLARLDAKAGEQYTLASASSKEALPPEEKHWAEYTPRELERQVELQNPQSQHNWLKAHTKVPPASDRLIDDDNESLASHDTPINKPSSAARKRGGGGGKDNTKTLAKQVGDRAVERAREGWSPSAASDEEVGSSKKRTRDPDGTYRLKGSKGGGGGGGGGASKNKRKRSITAAEDVGGGGKKRARLEGEEGEGDEVDSRTM